VAAEETDSEDDALKTLTVHIDSTTDTGIGSRMILCVSLETSRLGHECAVLSMRSDKLAGDDAVDARDIHRVNSSTYNFAHGLFSHEIMRCAVGGPGHI